MNATLADHPPLRLLARKATSFPEGIEEAYDTLEDRLPTVLGRRFYGVSYRTPAGIEYHAGVVPDSEREERELGLPILEIPAGRCASVTLTDWLGRTERIGECVRELSAQFGRDPLRPTLVERRSMREIRILVPVPADAR